MSLFNSLKKLFFATESVAKSASEKALQEAKELGNDVSQKAKDIAVQAESKISGLKDDVLQKSQDLQKSASDMSTSLGQTLSDKMEKALDLGEEFIDSSTQKVQEIVEEISESDVVKKAGEFTENIGAKVITSADQAWDNVAQTSEKVGSVILEKGSDLKEKAGEIADKIREKSQEIGQKIEQKFDETVQKAQKFEAEEATKPQKDFSDEDLTTGPSLLEDKGDFFSKAEKFAKGDYNAMKEGKIEIINEPSTATSKPIAPIAGQDDLDGDGNEQIDDAIVVKD